MLFDDRVDLAHDPDGLVEDDDDLLVVGIRIVLPREKLCPMPEVTQAVIDRETIRTLRGGRSRPCPQKRAWLVASRHARSMLA